MQRRFPSRRFPPPFPNRRRFPHRRPAGLGLINLAAAAVLGVIVYRKVVEEGKKQAESQKPE